MHLMMSNKDAINKATGQRVRDMRLKRDLTGSQLAELIGVNMSTLYAYETGDHSIPSDKKKRQTG